MPTVYEVVKLNDSLFSNGDSTGMYLQANQDTAWVEAEEITEVWSRQKEMLANRHGRGRRSGSSTLSTEWSAVDLNWGYSAFFVFLFSILQGTF